MRGIQVFVALAHGGQLYSTNSQKPRIGTRDEQLPLVDSRGTENPADDVIGCMTCHQVNGQGIPPVFPSLVRQGLATGSIAEHIDMVLNGKTGTAMQAFAAQLNPAQLAAVITYERNAWGNNMGEIIQPREINEMLTGGEG